ncbi:MAG: aldo/keto reductase [Chitinophagaceae bacterium]|nr:aldo/keto reductase [Chitinophagaceae bacterium]
MSDISNFSRITLGTVQLGLPYGLHAGPEAPDQSTAHDILDAAVECGINVLDTARSYGTAEEVIAGHEGIRGRACFEHIVTKFTLDDAAAGFEALRRQVRSSLEASLQAMGRPRVSVLLLGDILQELTEDGLIGAGGLSAYRPEDVEPVVGHPAFRCVQVPFNLLDPALLRNGRLQVLRQAGIFVFIRSVFLKGLLLTDPGHLPADLRDAAGPLKRLSFLAARANMSIAEAAFSYVHHQEGVGSLVIGADTARQLRENCALMAVQRIPDELAAEMEVIALKIPERIIIPGRWQTK